MTSKYSNTRRWRLLLLVLGGTLMPPLPTPAFAPHGVPPLAAPIQPPMPDTRTLELGIGHGDTVLGLLLRHGIDRASAGAAVEALRKLCDLRELRPDDMLVVRLGTAPDAVRPQLLALQLETARHPELTVVADANGGFRRGTEADAALQRVARRRSGVLGAWRPDALERAGVPAPVAREFMTAFADDPELHGTPPSGTPFSLVYEAYAAGAGDERMEAPELRYAAVRIGDQEHRVYRYTTASGQVAFVDGRGRGTLPLHLAAPLPGAPITSPWGWRIHPILKVRRFHKGTDFGAPAGTPVHAAADGVIEDIGWRGNYGRYLRIRHSDRLKTVYAHLGGFAPGLARGSRVHRGQVIARVGETGWATGPHLYYEVIVDGHRVDPESDLRLSVRVPRPALQRMKSRIAAIEDAIPSALACADYVSLDCRARNLAATLSGGDLLAHLESGAPESD